MGKGGKKNNRKEEEVLPEIFRDLYVMCSVLKFGWEVHLFLVTSYCLETV